MRYELWGKTMLDSIQGLDRSILRHKLLEEGFVVSGEGKGDFEIYDGNSLVGRLNGNFLEVLGCSQRLKIFASNYATEGTQIDTSYKKL